VTRTSTDCEFVPPISGPSKRQGIHPGAGQDGRALRERKWRSDDLEGVALDDGGELVRIRFDGGGRRPARDDGHAAGDEELLDARRNERGAQARAF
jgi:hypothetical protein